MNRLLSYAYLKASHDFGQTNPLALLQNVVIDILRKLRGKSITTAEVMARVESDWGFKLPQRVIQSIIRQKYVEQFYTYEGDGKYAIVRSAPYFDRLVELSEQAEADLSLVRKAVTRELLAQHLRQSLSADEVISDWLDTSSIGFFNGASEGGISSQDIKVNAIIASCIGVGNSKDEQFISALTALALGDLLYRAMSELTEADTEEANPEKNTRMTNVAMFLDVGVLSRLRGYNLYEEQQATTDFIDMCRRTGCRIQIFSHTVAEFKKVCTAGLLQVGRRVGHGPMGTYCITAGRPPSDVLEEVVNIENFLEQSGIEIVETPGFEKEKYDIEFNGVELLKLIADEFSGEVQNRTVYRGDEADYNDYLSLRGIFVLRGNAPTRSLETCGALFLTNTYKLQKVANRFFHRLFAEQGERNEVQICFTESGIAPRIWLKLPTDFSKVARGQIIKTALSNLNPSKAMREGFLDYVRNLVNTRVVSEAQALELKYSKYVEYALAIEGAFNGGSESHNQFPSIVEDALVESRERVKQAARQGRAAGLAQAKTEIERLERLRADEAALFASQYATQIDNLREEIGSVERSLEAEKARGAIVEGRYRKALLALALIILPGAIFLAEIVPVIMGEEELRAWKLVVFGGIVLLAIFAVLFGVENEEGRKKLARRWSNRRASNREKSD